MVKPNCKSGCELMCACVNEEREGERERERERKVFDDADL